MATGAIGAQPAVDFLQIGRHYTQPLPPVDPPAQQIPAENAAVSTNPESQPALTSCKMRRQSM
ncbi:hypothetical protein CBM2633_A50397 [Cupriavidus taiwanensis]|nr:hypothetical protein CBM2633_A50397 [Cupriavidus taiwanensis]